MVKKYGMVKVMFPEEEAEEESSELLEDDCQSGGGGQRRPQCPIFMSKEFLKPSENSGKTALVLI